MNNELTREDIKKMQEELDYRRLELMPGLIEEVKRTRAFGDLSENFEYKAAKREKNRNDSRIRYLERMIRTAKVIEVKEVADEVGLFDTVTIFNELAKKEMRKMEIDEELIAMATGTAEIDDEEVNNAREIYRGLYEKFKAEIAPEAEKVREAGGLYILGTERHESRRIDNQLRGRSGRQGDPGSSIFYVSLEDKLMRLFGSERIAGVVDKLGMADHEALEAPMLNSSIERAQKKVEENNFGIRKRLLEYDDVMNSQREVIYTKRRNALSGERVEIDVMNMIQDIFLCHWIQRKSI